MNAPSDPQTPTAAEPALEASAGFGVMEDVAMYVAIATACFVLASLFV